MEKIPESMAIVGGGAVGSEFACLFHELGTEVTVIEKTGGLLPGEDRQIVTAIRKSFEKRGIRVYDSATVSRMDRKNDRWEATLSNQVRITAESVLVCAGRRPNCDSLDLEKAGIRHSRHGIEVDSSLRTSNPDVYGAGDVTGLSLLAHAGSIQGEIASANALGENEIYDGNLVPRCLYTWPEVASVGMWAHQADAKGIEAKSQRFFFEGSGRAMAEGETEGFIQVVSDKKTDEILGAQIIGPHATEMIHIISVALKGRMTRRKFREVIFAHPTFSEGIRAALER
jgi:dihydrolipoamide dehydrogenase